MARFAGRKILLCLTGSIAAYKSAFLTRLLIKEGAIVKVVMTRDACHFIAPLTLSTLTRQEVLTDLVDDSKTWWNSHVELGLWADLMVVAPASANTLAKMAHGLCDNLLTAIYLSARCPVCIAPAMDLDMWKHPGTQRNLELLKLDGVHLIPVGTGELASGLTGPGRMAEPVEILAYLEQRFITPGKKKRLSGKKALVTAGPTYEAIDPVRFIGNHSSGKMGIAIAESLANEGAAVELVLGPSAFLPQHPSITVTRITSAQEMYNATLSKYKQSDITVMAAAVADYTPEKAAAEKIKKKNGSILHLSLKKTSDILKELGRKKHKGQLLVGFALETSNELRNASEKLRKKNLDLIVMNSLRDPGAGFQHDTNKITVMNRAEKLFPFKLKRKQEVARDIVDLIIQHLK